ncbi:hypothetical protein HID58_037984 [Brassica napus]|uniref:Uncharacterized protein n=1 Tax=Brassica napus TaxID=3708 RepID=A0ABQ8BNQ1_BRANA|nr:hypothetical protein HID58_037984 [Brassica napus]
MFLQCRRALYVEEIDSDTSSKEGIDVRLKWIGGKFMMRLSNGVTTSAHTLYLVNVIREYGEDGCDNKTDWQICGVVLPNVPEILKGHAVLVRFIVM